LEINAMLLVPKDETWLFEYNRQPIILLLPTNWVVIWKDGCLRWNEWHITYCGIKQN